ncbi:hypothetical protein EVAR_97964_1 [Eumeta japonica]|uniref:Uncharacterized protein n=1 Tax=Eumeta variegata TaxID=151549 RepID=A0A4C1XI69_EUMVA|nr:hypothetical protein EVAR_97964_1 [Eumeta japonica]
MNTCNTNGVTSALPTLGRNRIPGGGADRPAMGEEGWNSEPIEIVTCTFVTAGPSLTRALPASGGRTKRLVNKKVPPKIDACPSHALTSDVIENLQIKSLRSASHKSYERFAAARSQGRKNGAKAPPTDRARLTSQSVVRTRPRAADCRRGRTGRRRGRKRRPRPVLSHPEAPAETGPFSFLVIIEIGSQVLLLSRGAPLALITRCRRPLRTPTALSSATLRARTDMGIVEVAGDRGWGLRQCFDLHECTID